MTPLTRPPDSRNARLDPLRRPSGAFAMLAVDQREALRVMMTEAVGADRPVDDAAMIEFKLTAARLLTPEGSAVLLDREFAFDRAVDEQVVDERCALICSADRFIPAHGQVVGEVEIDRLVDPGHVSDRGAVALKLLVLHRTDQPGSDRREMVDEFISICDQAGLASIIEPICRPPLDLEMAWDHDDAIVAAAEELGSRGADLYKGEVPLRGRVHAGNEIEMRERCRAITGAVDSPWVVLSSGVAESDFPNAIEVACEEGASGFLAGRAVWASCLSAPDVSNCLAGPAASRLRHFADVADRAVHGRRGLVDTDQVGRVSR